MIKSIKIGNFKSVRDLEIELAPLTIFAGPNGSGKSSILEAVALMGQCIAKNDEIVRSITGELVDFEDKKNIFCKEIESQWLSLGFRSETDIEEIEYACKQDLKRLSQIIERLPEGKAKNLHADFLNWLHHLVRNLDSKRASKKNIVRIEYLNRIRGDRNSFDHSYSMNGIQIKCMSDGKEQESIPSGLLAPGRRQFLTSLIIHDYESEVFKRLVDILTRKIREVYYLSADRGFVPWIYEPRSPPATWVGKTGEYTLEILARLSKPEYDDKRLPYELFCDRFGIRYAWAGWHRKSVLTSNYKDPYLDSSHKFPSLGFGSKQLLPVITQLAYSDPGNILLIEEPELSLHPAYQRLLPALFARAVNEGKQILVTTHSSYFPLSVGSVLKGFELRGQTTRGRKRYGIKLSVDDVLVYHVERNKKGYTKTRKLGIDKNGLTEAIPSFVKVEREILGKFIGKE